MNKRQLSSFSEGLEGEEEADGDDYPDSEDENEDDDASVLRRSSRVAKSILYWVTDAER